MAKAENIKTHVRNVLKKAGLYRPEISYQIEMLANDLIIYRKLAEEAATVESAIIEETAREGTTRMKPHPIFAMVQAQANQLRQDLKALLMNYDKTDNKGKGQKEDNTLAEFMNKIQQEEEEE